VTTAYVALLRSVNVGGHGRLAMADLQAAFGGLGFADTQTYLASGNVLFTADHEVEEADLERRAGTILGVTVTIMLRSRSELRDVMRANPFPTADARTLHVGFLSRTASVRAADLDALQADLGRFPPERSVMAPPHVYFHLPHGMGRAKLPERVERRVGPMTVRSWRTVHALAGAEAPSPGGADFPHLEEQ
jgi:uncharacterized protein (DUF1697 family)